MRAETPFRLRACKAIDREWREIAVRFKTVFKAWANDEAPLAEYPAVRHRSTESGRSGVRGNLFGLLDLAGHVLAQQVLLDLAGGGHRQRCDQFEPFGRLLDRETALLQVGLQVVERRGAVGSEGTT